MTVRTHPAVTASSAEPCPFCGCGSPLAAHVNRPRPRRLRVMEDRTGYPRVPQSLFHRSTAAELAAAATWYASTIGTWEAHRLAGEVPVITDGRTNVEWRKAA